MKKGTKNLVGTLIIVLLICLIFAVIENKRGVKSKEVVAAKGFINKLSENDIINSNKKVKELKLMEKKNQGGEIESYEVKSDDLLVELDKDYNVIKFVDKDQDGKIKSVSKDDAIKLANQYIKVIVDDEYKFNKVLDETLKDNISYYSATFKKYYKGYPDYSVDVVLNINKNSGKLEGYSNSSYNKKYKDAKINITIEEAEEKCEKAFNSVMKNGKEKSKPELAFGERRNSKEDLELCYIVKVYGESNDGLPKEIIYFISTETGEIINSFSSNVEEIKSE